MTGPGTTARRSPQRRPSAPSRRAVGPWPEAWLYGHGCTQSQRRRRVTRRAVAQRRSREAAWTAPTPVRHPRRYARPDQRKPSNNPSASPSDTESTLTVRPGFLAVDSTTGAVPAGRPLLWGRTRAARALYVTRLQPCLLRPSRPPSSGARRGVRHRVRDPSRPPSRPFAAHGSRASVTATGRSVERCTAYGRTLSSARAAPPLFTRPRRAVSLCPHRCRQAQDPTSQVAPRTRPVRCSGHSLGSHPVRSLGRSGRSRPTVSAPLSPVHGASPRAPAETGRCVQRAVLPSRQRRRNLSAPIRRVGADYIAPCKQSYFHARNRARNRPDYIRARSQDFEQGAV